MKHLFFGLLLIILSMAGIAQTRIIYADQFRLKTVTIDNISLDTAFAGAVDTKLSTQKAIRDYVINHINAMPYVPYTNATTNINLNAKTLSNASQVVVNNGGAFALGGISGVTAIGGYSSAGVGVYGLSTSQRGGFFRSENYVGMATMSGYDTIARFETPTRLRSFLDSSGVWKAYGFKIYGGTASQVLLADGTTSSTTTYAPAFTVTTTGTNTSSTWNNTTKTFNLPTLDFSSIAVDLTNYYTKTSTDSSIVTKIDSGYLATAVGFSTDQFTGDGSESNRIAIKPTILSADGTAAAFSASVTSPKFVGGTGNNSPITFQATSGTASASGATFKWAGGNNGGTTYMTMLNGGNLGLGIASPGRIFEINSPTSPVVRFSGAGGATVYDLGIINGTTGNLQAQRGDCSNCNGQYGIFPKGTGFSIGGRNLAAGLVANLLDAVTTPANQESIRMEAWQGYGGAIIMDKAGTGVARPITIDATTGSRSTLKQLILSSTEEVSIGSQTFAASAKFQVVSTTQGTILNKMTNTQRDAIASPAEGLIIYSLTDHIYQFWNGTAWTNF